MSINPRRRQLTTFQSKVLSVATSLADRSTQLPLGLDLDEIDGEFYWRCGKEGLEQALDHARDTWKNIWDVDVYERLRELATDVTYIFNSYGLSEAVALNYIASNKPLFLRGSTVTGDFIKGSSGHAYDYGTGSPGQARRNQSIVARIAAPSWDGKRVEQLMREWLSADGYVIDDEQKHLRITDEYGYLPYNFRPDEFVSFSVRCMLVTKLDSFFDGSDYARFGLHISQPGL